jgi:tetratricopeptide (TPR) repeat protein
MCYLSGTDPSGESMPLSDHDVRAAAAEGWASARRDDPAPTVSYFERLLDSYPEEALALYHCARACDYSGQPDKALPLYEQAFAAGLSGDELRQGFARHGQFPEDAVIRCYLALAMESLGRSTQAVALLLDLVVERVDDPDVATHSWALRNYAAALRRGYWSPDGAATR